MFKFTCKQILLLSILGNAGHAVGFEQNNEQWIDLTHEFSEETLYWPTSEKFDHDELFFGRTDKDYFYSAYEFSAAEHGGTHIDAPIHFAEGKQTLEKIPLDHLMGHAVVIDVTESSMKNPDYLVSVKDFQQFEKQNGSIPNQSIILLNTGYHAFWPDAKKYLGTNQRGKQAVKQLHFPGLSAEAAEWLVKNDKVKAIGIDTASIDYGQSTTYESHQILAKNNIPIFENVGDLNKLPSQGAYIVALPFKIKGGSGGPLRIIAQLSD